MGEYNNEHVVLKKMVFNRFLLINTPPLHLGHVQRLPGVQPSTIQCVPERAMSHIECLPLWKGGILVLKYDHEEEMLADISYVDVRLCHALVQTAIICR